MSDTQALLEVQNLSVTRSGRAILSQLSFSIAEGEFLALVGPNGAGKTTLLRSLAGLGQFEGKVSLLGEGLGSYSRRKLAKLVAYVPQSIELAFPFSVHEFVSFGRYPHLERFGALSPADKRCIESALSRVGMSEFAAREVRSLSGGEKQRVLLAAALTQEPKLLLLDEPTAYLDPKRQRELVELLQKLAGEGISVIAVTHDVNGMAARAHFVLALRGGVHCFFGTAEEFLNTAVLGNLYDEHFSLVVHPQTQRTIAVQG